VTSAAAAAGEGGARVLAPEAWAAADERGWAAAAVEEAAMRSD
jgi:hypothetical protein